MAYDGIFRAETILTTQLGAPFAAEVVTVNAEQTLSAPAPGTVYTYPLQDWPLGDNRPVEILGPQGPLDGNQASTTGELVYWVTVSGNDADRVTLAGHLKVYLTALVRVLDNQNAPDGRWSTSVGQVDYAPPQTGRDSTFTGAVGVQVTVHIADTK